MRKSLKEFMETSFAADDLRLFLDTHPQDERALEDYRTVAESAEEKRVRLEEPVNPMDAGKNGVWDWTATPWPWEKEA